MHITFYFKTPLPVKKYGGIERIVFWHMKELARQKHQVTLIGHSKSKVEELGIKLIPIRDEDWRFLIPRDTDIIILCNTPHYEIDFPFLVRIDGNGDVGETYNQNTVFVSRKHAENHNAVDFIYNGIDLEEYPYNKPSKKAWNQFIFLANASWIVKNVEHCIMACRAQKKHLHIAGGRTWKLSRFIHGHGMVGQNKKIPLLKRAHALLFPVRWHEPFGIAIIEAMAMGVPVIGSPYGSLPELIISEVGEICKNYQEFEDVIGRDYNRFYADTIRQYVEERFSIKKTTEEYLKRYEKVIQGKYIQPQKPSTKEGFLRDALLPF